MKNIIIVIIFFFPLICIAQKYGNVWQFGEHAGIDFNSCNPIAITNGANSGFEGSASVCDTSGQLLFYTNSDTVWSKLHVAMPNGFLISSGGTLSQVIIISKPLSDSIYYVITTKIQAQGTLSLRYHVVDMSQNGGLGDVVSSNNILSNLNITEQIAATYHSNGFDIWLMAHEYLTNNFLCYLITSSGINNSPVVSGVGTPIPYCNSNTNARGEMKFSPGGTKVAINNNGSGDYPFSDVMELFDFDNNTGIVSNPINLPAERGGFGLSFSPDNTKLYGATWKALNFFITDSNKLFQFDLSSGNPITIANSKQILFGGPLLQQSFGAIKIGPDEKLYVANYNSTYLGVINSPNIAGTNCNYINNGFYLGGQTSEYGLNNYIEYSIYCIPSAISEVDENQNLISIFPDPFVNELNVVMSKKEFFEITLYDITSRKTLQQKFKNSASLNTEQLAKGLYLYEVRNKNGVVNKGKVVKE
jgi:hypothetical protein